jgi:hypothetical protein
MIIENGIPEIIIDRGMFNRPDSPSWADQEIGVPGEVVVVVRIKFRKEIQCPGCRDARPCVSTNIR